MRRLPWALIAGLVAASTLLVSGGGAAESTSFFITRLSGAEEVPPRVTPASGIAIVSSDGNQISYSVGVSNITNVVAAHIHLGGPGVNGPIVLTLSSTSRPGAFTGLLASARGASPPLEGPLAGQPLSVLLAHMQAGNTYVNVHTNDGVGQPNSGPGDFPGGEIRGQLQPDVTADSGGSPRRGRDGRPSGVPAVLPSGRGQEVDFQLARLRVATLPFHSVAAAEAAGYVRASPCVSSPAGVMGIHFGNAALMADDAIDIERPEELLYLPTASGLRLIAVEYHKRDADQNLATDADRPSLFGVPFDGPMPGHGPPANPGPVHFDLHVWVWEFNPSGIFSQWNPNLRCPA